MDNTTEDITVPAQEIRKPETTRLSSVQMIITSLALLGLFAGIIYGTLFAPEDIFSRLSMLIPSSETTQSPEQTVLPEELEENETTPPATSTPIASAGASPKLATPEPTPVIQTIVAVAGQNGIVTDTGTVNSIGFIDVGRTPDSILRGFVGFDLSQLPPKAQILKATLRLHQRAIIGNPFGVLGQIQVDHVDSGTALTPGSYSGGNVYEAAFGTIGSLEQTAWTTLDVTKQVQKDVLVHSSSQFRLHFSTETKGGEGQGDMVSFWNAQNGNEQPQLIVEY